MTVARWVIVASLLLDGCAPLTHETPIMSPGSPPPDERCDGWDRGHVTWSAIAAGAGALSGTSGLTTIATEDKGARVALALGAAGAGAIAVAAAFVANADASRFTAHCAGSSVARPR